MFNCYLYSCCGQFPCIVNTKHCQKICKEKCVHNIEINLKCDTSIILNSIQNINWNLSCNISNNSCYEYSNILQKICFKDSLNCICDFDSITSKFSLKHFQSELFNITFTTLAKCKDTIIITDSLFYKGENFQNKIKILPFSYEKEVIDSSLKCISKVIDYSKKIINNKFYYNYLIRLQMPLDNKIDTLICNIEPKIINNVLNATIEPSRITIYRKKSSDIVLKLVTNKKIISNLSICLKINSINGKYKLNSTINLKDDVKE